ncbi:cytochrome C [Rhodospirillum rubrum]|uniref:cytochrome C n=1 Tax=Rhodospirillum rubrum TaxID=1085 RepID=UPI0019038DFB|nr:cytochrome C [Rhodospirillum rubrum]MBK1663439.1 cytochrome C [Rhodospirillum rubrum]MBK1675378.1 cytochrome C [Rhodospirillum rubrum]
MTHRLFLVLAAIGLGWGWTATARAGDDFIAPVSDPLTLRECGECHMAFAPGFLPARSWRAMMAGLADHFGQDASLAEGDRAAITATLEAGAADAPGRRRGLAAEFLGWVDPAGTPLRLTLNPAFLHEHRRLTPERLSARGVRSITACPACHRNAERGWFDDD